MSQLNQSAGSELSALIADTEAILASVGSTSASASGSGSGSGQRKATSTSSHQPATTTTNVSSGGSSSGGVGGTERGSAAAPSFITSAAPPRMPPPSAALATAAGQTVAARPSPSAGGSGMDTLNRSLASLSAVSRRYENEKLQVSSSANAAARSLSPPPPQRRPITPSSFSPARLFARARSASPTRAAVETVEPRPGSPRARAREEIARADVESSVASASMLHTTAASRGRPRTPTLTSPVRPFQPGSSMGSSFRSASLSPSRFQAVAAATRAQAAQLDSTLRFENLTDTSTATTAVRSPMRQAQMSPGRASMRSLARSPSRSPTRSPPQARFSSSRPSAVDTSAAIAAASAASYAAGASSVRGGVYVHAPLEPWRELNRQLALNQLPLILPFPVPASTTMQGSTATAHGETEIPWSPGTKKLFEAVPRSTNATPAASLTLLLTTCSKLLADYARRGQTIEELMSAQNQRMNNHQACHAEIAALRRSNQQQVQAIKDLQQSLEHASRDRASTVTQLSSQVDASAAQFASLERKYTQILADSANKDATISSLREELEETHTRAERQRASDVERFTRERRDLETAHARSIAASEEAKRGVERELHDCQLALLTTQKANADLKEQHALREQEHVRTVARLQRQAEEEANALRAQMHEQEEDAAAVRHNLEQQIQLLTEQKTELQTSLHQSQTDLSHTKHERDEAHRRIAKLDGRLNAAKEEAASAHAHAAAIDDELQRAQEDGRQKSARIEALEEKAHVLERQAIEGYNVQELRRHLSHHDPDQALMSDHRRVASSFQVDQLQNLPQPVAVDILSPICQRLEVEDATQVGKEVDKLIKVASVVPHMQEFMQQIADIVNDSEDGIGVGGQVDGGDTLVELTSNLLPILESWSENTREVRRLNRFRSNIVEVLRRRVHRSPLNPLYTPSGAGVSCTSQSKVHEGLNDEDLVAEVGDIVSNENRLNALVYDQQSPSSFFQLWAAMDKAPLLREGETSTDPDRILNHIQQLFDVPHRVGLYPRMNELFLYVNETRPAIQAMRQLLGLDGKATIQTCVKALKRLMESRGGGLPDGWNEMSFAASHNGITNGHMSSSASRARSQSPVRSTSRGLAWTVSSPSKHETSFVSMSGHGPSTSMSTSTAAAGVAPSTSHAQMQRNAAYFNVCRQLKSLLGVRKLSEIVPSVSQLKRDLASARTLTPNRQQQRQHDFIARSVLAELKATLHVDRAEDIPREVDALRAERDEARRRAATVERSAAGHAGSQETAMEVARSLQAQREEFIAGLKKIAGVAGEDDTALLAAITRMRDTARSSSSSPTRSLPLAGGMSITQQEEAQRTLAQLKGYLDVQSVSAIVPHVRSLLNKIHAYDELYPRLDKMVNQLHDILGISQMDLIVPTVRRLQQQAASGSGGNGNGVGRSSGSALLSSSSSSGMAPSSALKSTVSASPFRASESRVTFDDDAEDDDENDLASYAPAAGTGGSRARETIERSRSGATLSTAAQRMLREKEDRELEAAIDRTLQERR